MSTSLASSIQTDLNGTLDGDEAPLNSWVVVDLDHLPLIF